LVGLPVAKPLFGNDGSPTTIYVRADPDQVTGVQSVLAATANPEHPNEVQVSRPSAALAAQAAAKSALNALLLGLGGVALLVGGVGIANVMVIGVLERRGEVGLRRALGATKGHIRTQFVVESLLLALLGGAGGVALGALVTAGCSGRGWRRRRGRRRPGSRPPWPRQALVYPVGPGHPGDLPAKGRQLGAAQAGHAETASSAGDPVSIMIRRREATGCIAATSSGGGTS
jgi:FtsX-like permease family protein